MLFNLSFFKKQNKIRNQNTTVVVEILRKINKVNKLKKNTNIVVGSNQSFQGKFITLNLKVVLT